MAHSFSLIKYGGLFETNTVQALGDLMKTLASRYNVFKNCQFLEPLVPSRMVVLK